MISVLRSCGENGYQKHLLTQNQCPFFHKASPQSFVPTSTIPQDTGDHLKYFSLQTKAKLACSPTINQYEGGGNSFTSCRTIGGSDHQRQRSQSHRRRGCRALRRYLVLSSSLAELYLMGFSMNSGLLAQPHYTSSKSTKMLIHVVTTVKRFTSTKLQPTKPLHLYSQH